MKKRGLIGIVILLFLLGSNIICGLETKQEEQNPEPTTEELTQTITESGNLAQVTLTKELTYNGVTFPVGSSIEVNSGLITASDVQTQEGVYFSVSDAKIENGKITEGSFETFTANVQNAKGATITRDETNIESASYMTATPTSSSGTTTLVNANNIRLTRTELYVAHADTITVGGANNIRLTQPKSL